MTIRSKSLSTALVMAIAIQTLGTAYAACSGVNCTTVSLDRIYLESDGDVSFSTSGNEEDLSCTPGVSGGEGIYLTLQATHAGFQPIYAFLLTAFETRSTFNVRVSSSGTCFVSYLWADK